MSGCETSKKPRAGRCGLGLWSGCVLVVAALGACRERRTEPAPEPAYESEIAALLGARCERCHHGPDAGAGYRVDSYLGTLACPKTQPSRPAAVSGDGGTPILEVLERPDHGSVLDADERARLEAWVAAQAPLRTHGVHGAGILNPRSRDWHGRLAARDGFGPLQRASHPDACGRCHAGAPAGRVGVPAPGATACTDCHEDAAGVFACGTCHGDGAARAYPPRDLCAFPAARRDAHAAHLESARLSTTLQLDCSTCHPAADALFSGTHANGRVDVQLDPELAGDSASYDREQRRCAVSCHQRGGSLPMPRFDDEGPLECGSCHGMPPENHYAGACQQCHREMDARGSTLADARLHLNGRLDLGSGGDACGACHGDGDDPMPRTPSHALHRDTMLTAAVTCGDCHPVPDHVSSPGHLDIGEPDPVDVTWSARATAWDQQPSYSEGTCRQIACHGSGLPEAIERALVWDASATQDCAGCHGLPPVVDHPRDSTCASVICHGAQVAVGTAGTPTITQAGRATHIDGKADRATR